MLCGLLPATGGTLRVAGMDLRYARALARQHIGYVAQKFSLYGQLSVTENLESSPALTACAQAGSGTASTGQWSVVAEQRG
jgi:ABC-type multidrug transport system ATPase subunit